MGERIVITFFEMILKIFLLSILCRSESLACVSHPMTRDFHNQTKIVTTMTNHTIVKTIMINSTIIVPKTRPVTVNTPKIFYESDMVFSKHFSGDNENLDPIKSQSPFIPDVEPKWPDAKMFYVIDEDYFDPEEIEVIQDAMNEITQKTCFQFQKRSEESPEPDFVKITANSTGCWSYVGRQGIGQQFLNLDPYQDCVIHGTVIHELMHSMGFYHEHSRSDRTQFVTVNTDKIVKANMTRAQFNIIQAATRTTFDLPYDLQSVMHYGSTDASQDGAETISQTIGKFNIGQRIGLSATDARRVKLMYGISDQDCPCGGLVCDGRMECIWSGRVCDQTFDCLDGSDEKECTELTCPEYRFRCDDGQCIDEDVRCTGYPHCKDGSDERNCAVCKLGAFHCLSDNTTCLSGDDRCDGTADCPDGSDEVGCKKCRVTEFLCDNGQCVDGNLRCDGETDCRDNSDEKNCTRCVRHKWTCHDGTQCVFKSWRCDGMKDCMDGSDEENCPTCPADSFRCDSGQCIPSIGRCSTGVNRLDCADESDEKNCPVCPTQAFHCGSGECLSRRLICNGFKDCADGSDERDCPATKTVLGVSDEEEDLSL